MISIRKIQGPLSLITLIYFLSMVLGCDVNRSDRGTRVSGPLIIQIDVPDDLGEYREALEWAREDLLLASTEISGASRVSDHSLISIRIVLDQDLSADLGTQGYQLHRDDDEVIVTASNALGAAYALYHIAGDLGARYIHPEQSILPKNPNVTMPNYTQEKHRPHYERRGFHEHTQHPIVMSELMLKANQDGYRQWISHYLRWLLRNRQNTLTFHMLNTVDLESWVPYLTEITAEAQTIGIEVGLISGFVDQQQNAFRLVMPDDARSAEQQIVEKLDVFASTGISVLGLQLGTSEFTKPDEQLIVDWLNLATSHLAMTKPDLSVYAWIHITCGLDQADGSPYYHLPLQADERLGAFVHTTMFYTIDHSAPVYDCEDFTHQRDFLDEANQSREQVFFPETAWWLGFDNNVPLVNPITGLSREYDILEALPTWDVTGHVTFTTGKEWTYWQYDHYLTQVTWSGELTWLDYLHWLSPIYGEHAEVVVTVLDEWARLQWTDLYEEHPEIYFYLAGELPQDELGEQAGVIARQPKLSFRKVLEMNDEEFSSWYRTDFEFLQEMLSRYQDLFETLPVYEEGDSSLYLELYTAYQLFTLRIQHAIALYAGVISTREGQRTQAEEHLVRAKQIGQDALSHVRRVEPYYRYPDTMLIEKNPQSLTAYPFGYLHETSTGYFWIRREEQLTQLITDRFEAPQEEWETGLLGEVFVAEGNTLSLLVPDSVVLQGALAGFVPRLLWVETSFVPEENMDSEHKAFILAQDYNLNGAPDIETQQKFLVHLASNDDGEQDIWAGGSDEYSLLVRDASGVEVGRLTINDLALSIVMGDEGQPPNELYLEGTVAPNQVIALVTSVAGIEPAALAQLIKNVWGLPVSDDLPERLPLKVKLILSLLSDME